MLINIFKKFKINKLNNCSRLKTNHKQNHLIIMKIFKNQNLQWFINSAILFTNIQINQKYKLFKNKIKITLVKFINFFKKNYYKNNN